VSRAQSLKEESESIKMKFKEKDKCYYLSRLVLSGAVWHLWQEETGEYFRIRA